MQFDKELVLDLLYQIQEALKVVKKRCMFAKCEDDFFDTEEGQEKLDGICMKLIAVGESLKNIDKMTNNQLLNKYNHISWKDIKGIRDILSHHYFDLDASIIFNICQEHIDDLINTIEIMIVDLDS